MPELPEVEVTARLIDHAVASARVRSARAVGVSTLKTFQPPLDALEGRRLVRVSRRGKHLLISFEDDLHLLVHLMSAGRLQLYEKQASPRDRTARLLLNLEDGRQLRLREFGTRQSAWAMVLEGRSLHEHPALVTLGPEAWPDPPPFRPLLDQPRPLNSLIRDQRVIAGIGRSWADEILHEARLSPFKRGSDLSAAQAEELRAATLASLGGAIDHYLQTLHIPIPDKLPMPLRIHHRRGEACPRCGAHLQAVHFEEHDMCYCPQCQTGGKVLKDRRLSRLLK